jgi:predicted DsbA family dithiol-disulfide isomerase
LIGAKAAEAQGKGPQYHDAVFRAYWQRANNIGAVEVLAEIAHAIGLEREAFLAALKDEQYDTKSVPISSKPIVRADGVRR